ncbi:MAG: RecX family transcriptional regulator [Sphingobacteriaceae bacterium]|nr:RecX family transcriptional regulator [Sphingobacteriaceae bacterium]
MKNTKQTPIILDKKKALAKLEQFCAYQERSQQEVRDKLYTYGLFSSEVEEVISLLIENNFLNEERFSIAYAGGKFRIKKWGRGKIKQGLRLKKVPEKMIQKVLNDIDGDEYFKTIVELLEKKSRLINENNPLKRKIKLISYLQSKGFENDLIFEALKDNNLT